MTTRSVGTASIELLTLSVGVRLFTTSATKKSTEARLVPLHASDHGRLVPKQVCSVCGEFVEHADTVRGCEHAKGHHLALSALELAELDALASNSIDLDQLVPLDCIDSIYVEKSFYLAPQAGAETRFGLILEALRAEKLAAVGTHSTNRRTTIAVVRPFEHLLLLQHLRQPREVVDCSTVPASEATISNAALPEVQALIKPLRGAPLDLGRYRDSLHEQVQGVLRDKAKRAALSGPLAHAPNAGS